MPQNVYYSGKMLQSIYYSGERCYRMYTTQVRDAKKCILLTKYYPGDVRIDLYIYENLIYCVHKLFNKF